MPLRLRGRTRVGIGVRRQLSAACILRSGAPIGHPKNGIGLHDPKVVVCSGDLNGLIGGFILVRNGHHVAGDEDEDHRHHEERHQNFDQRVAATR
jgi:hypothetical protein